MSGHGFDGTSLIADSAMLMLTAPRAALPTQNTSHIINIQMRIAGGTNCTNRVSTRDEHAGTRHGKRRDRAIPTTS